MINSIIKTPVGEQLELCCIAMGITNGTLTLEKSLALSYKVKCTLTSQPSSLPPKYLPKWNENLCLHKTLYMNVNNNCIHNHQKLETTQMSLNWWMYKLCYISIKEYFPGIKRNKLLIHTTMWMNLKDITHCERSQIQTVIYISNNFIYMTLWKRQYNGNRNQKRSCQELEMGKRLMAIWDEKIWGVGEMKQYLIVMMVTWPYTFINAHRNVH